MARKKAPQVPGSTADAPAPTSAAELAAPAAPMAPAVARAMDGATKMSYADAVRLAGEGKLTERVLTEKGWYVPNVASPVP